MSAPFGVPILPVVEALYRPSAHVASQLGLPPSMAVTAQQISPSLGLMRLPATKQVPKKNKPTKRKLTAVAATITQPPPPPKKKNKTAAAPPALPPPRTLPVAVPRNLPGSQLRNTYSFPMTSIDAKEWAVHKNALTLIPENQHLKRHGKDKSWMRAKRAIRDFGAANGRYVVPPAYGLQQFGDALVDTRSDGILAPGLVWHGQPLWNTPEKHCNQELVVSKVLTHFATYKTGGVIELGTGSGKTELSIFIACKLQRKALFVVNSEELKKQTIDRVRGLCPAAKVGLIQGSKKCQVEGMDFVVCMLKTLAECACYTPDTFKDFGFVVFDEVEQMCAKRLSNGLRKTSHIRYGLGMTATCDRKDGMITLLEYWIGKLIYAAPVATPVTRLVTVQVLQFSLGAQEQHYLQGGDGDIDPDKTTKALVSDPIRNAFIFERILLRVKQGWRLVVVSQYVYQAYWLYRMCRKLHPELNAVWYRRGMKPELREFVLGMPHQVMFSNVALCGRGWNNVFIDGLIMCCSKPDIRQLIGRVRAFSKWRRNPLLVEDLADQFFYFLKQSQLRISIYKARENIILAPLVVDATTRGFIAPPPEFIADPCIMVDKALLPRAGDLASESQLPVMATIELLPLDAKPDTKESILKFMQKCREDDVSARGPSAISVVFDGSIEEEKEQEQEQTATMDLPD